MEKNVKGQKDIKQDQQKDNIESTTEETIEEAEETNTETIYKHIKRTSESYTLTDS